MLPSNTIFKQERVHIAASERRVVQTVDVADEIAEGNGDTVGTGIKTHRRRPSLWVYRC